MIVVITLAMVYFLTVAIAPVIGFVITSLCDR
jgi:hypothetical protein